MRERRVSPRVEAGFSVAYVHFKKEDRPKTRTTVIYLQGQYAMAEALDISCGGMSLRTSKPYEVGSYFDMRFKLGDHTLKAVGRIVYVQEREDYTYSIGVKFLYMPEKDKLHLMGYIAAKLDTVYEPTPA